GDGGGSIRNPAGACGVVGLKPSRGRITLGPDIGRSVSGCFPEFVIARSVRDLANVLDCVHGYFAGDPAPAPPPSRPYAQELGREPGRLPCCMFVGNAATPGSPDARAAVEGCAKLLAGLGHEVHDGYPHELDDNVIGSLLVVSVAASVAQKREIIAARRGEPFPPSGVEPATWWFGEQGRALTAIQYL